MSGTLSEALLCLLLFFISVLTVVAWAVITKSTYKVLALAVAATAAKLLLILANEINRILPFKPDAEIYFKFGLELSRADDWSIIIPIYAGKGVNSLGVAAYGVANATFIRLLGESKLYMPILNTTVYSCVILVFLKYLDTLSRKNGLGLSVRRRALFFGALLAFVYPAALSNTVINLRETIIALGFLLFVGELLRYKISALRHPVIYIGAALVILIRPIAIVVLFVSLALAVLIFQVRYKWPILIGSALSVLLGFTIFGKALLSRFSTEVILASVSERAESAAEAFPLDTHYQSLAALLFQMPERVFYFLFYPFPWVASSYKFLIPTVDALFNFALFGGAGILLFMLRSAQNGSESLSWLMRIFIFLFLVCGVGVSFYSLGEPQFGGAIRHRFPFILPLLLCLPLVYEQLAALRVERKRGRLFYLQNKANQARELQPW